MVLSWYFLQRHYIPDILHERSLAVEHHPLREVRVL